MATCDITGTAATPTPIDGINVLARKGINVYGRVDAATVSGEQGLRFVNSASGFEVCFKGTELIARLFQRCILSPNKNYLRVFVDGVDRVVPLDKNGIAEYTLVSGLDNGLHTVRAYKMVEEDFSEICLFDLSGKDIEFYTPRSMPEIKMTVFGDSITAGYGVLGKMNDVHTADLEDGTSTYAFLAAEKLGAQIEVLCMQGRSIAVPGWADDVLLKDVYDKYSVKSDKEWDYSASQPSDFIIINLGENDSHGVTVGYNGFRGTHEQFADGYKEMIAGLRKANPHAKIICCYGMMNGGLLFEEDICDMANELQAAGDTNIYVCKMKLCDAAHAGVNGHPGAENHRDNAQLLYDFITGLRRYQN